MTYRIEGLRPQDFKHLFGRPEDELKAMGVVRVIADGPGYPCRITLQDARPGEALLLLNHVSLDTDTPYRSAHAIYVREGAEEAASYVDEPAPVMATRTLSLRGFDSAGMLRDARLASPGVADEQIRTLFDNPDVAVIHAHNAAAGCFSARVVRD